MKGSKVNKKLKSFTILEVLIGMILTAILIGISYLGLRLFQGYFQELESRSELIQERMLFNAQFGEDWQRAVGIEQLGDSLLFEELESENLWYFNQGQAILNDSVIFQIAHQNINASGHFVRDSVYLIDSLSINWTLDSDERAQYFKFYPVLTSFYYGSSD